MSIKKSTVTIFVLAFLLSGCLANAAKHIEVAPPQQSLSITPKYVPLASKTPEVLPTPTQYTLEYKIIFENGDFIIRQAHIGSKDSYRQYDIPIPSNRIDDLPNESNKPTVEWVEYTSSPEVDMRFGKIARVPTNNGSINVFALDCEFLDCNGNAVLRKNDQEIWRGHMDGGIELPIHTMWSLNGEIIFDYSDSNYSELVNGHSEWNFWKKDYILYSHENSVSIIESAFYPNIINNQLVYFKDDGDGLLFLYFKHAPVGIGYEYIVNYTCCGYTLHDIRNNGKMIDDFPAKS
jgi:hypothetical protein